MNQGRSVYLDMCSRSIRSVVGLTSLQLQVRTVLAAWMLARSSLFSDQWLSLVLFNILEFLRKSKDTERHLKYAWNESLFHALVLGTFIKPGLSPAWQGRALMQHRKVFVFCPSGRWIPKLYLTNQHFQAYGRWWSLWCKESWFINNKIKHLSCWLQHRNAVSFTLDTAFLWGPYMIF